MFLNHVLDPLTDGRGEQGALCLFDAGQDGRTLRVQGIGQIQHLLPRLRPWAVRIALAPGELVAQFPGGVHAVGGEAHQGMVRVGAQWLGGRYRLYQKGACARPSARWPSERAAAPAREISGPLDGCRQGRKRQIIGEGADRFDGGLAQDWRH